MSTDFIASILPPTSIDEPAWWFIFCNQQVLLQQHESGWVLPRVQDIQAWQLPIVASHYLGTWRQQHCFTAEISTPSLLLPGFSLQPFRQAFQHFSDEIFTLASRALQILHWDKDHQFCGRCGHPLTPSTFELAKVCSHCQLSHYPRLSPSIIVVIKRHKEILLARSPHFSPGVYSALAGFVEPGETAEQALEREVFEEVGIKVKNLRYHGSQSWPFPHSFLLGFTADYAAGEIIIDGVEIEDAGWFTRANLPLLPPPLSISHRLIELSLTEET